MQRLRLSLTLERKLADAAQAPVDLVVLNDASRSLDALLARLERTHARGFDADAGGADERLQSERARQHALRGMMRAHCNTPCRLP